MKNIKSFVIFIFISLVVFEGCDKIKDLVEGKKEIHYTCTNNSGKTAFISYIGANGESISVDIDPHVSWGESVDFEKGDWVRIQAQCNATVGELSIEIRCRGCENIGEGSEKLREVIDLSVRNIVELSATLE